MTPFPSTPVQLQTRLERVETALYDDPDDIPLLVEQARCLHKLGQSWRARGAYLAVLSRGRYHCEAMLGLGELFLESGELDSARVVLSEAVARHPTSVATHGMLGSVLLEQDNLAAAESAPNCKPSWLP